MEARRVSGLHDDLRLAEYACVIQRANLENDRLRQGRCAGQDRRAARAAEFARHGMGQVGARVGFRSLWRLCNDVGDSAR